MIRVPAGFGGEDRIKRYLDYYQPSYGVMMLSAGQAFSPASLFAAGEQGAWYDPSDFTTMFQDSAGTTPVTAVEQPVGSILDKSGRNNHASQSTPASCPVLSARVNLLTYSEQFNNAAWIAASSGTAALGVKTNNYGIAPDGTTTAARIQLDVSAGSVGNQSQVYQIANVSNGASYKYSAWIRTNDSSTKTIMAFSGGATVPTSLTVNGTWTRYEAARTVGGSTDAFQFILIKGTTSDTADLLVWHPDARATNDGVGLPAYQRVTTSTDYDTTGFPYYLRFDGTDDSLATATFTPGTDKVQLFAGIRKTAGTNAAFAETSVNGGANAGTISLFAPATTADYFFRSRGSAITTAVTPSTSYPSPITNILTGLGDIAGDNMLLRLNGIQVGSNSSDQGTGNFLAYPLYIGRRGGTTLPFNGRLYSLIIRFGANLDATTISNTETWVNGKTMAY